MRKQLLAAAAVLAALAPVGIGSLTNSAHAFLTVPCASTNTWPGPVGPYTVPGVGQVGPVANPVPDPKPGHSTTVFVVDGSSEPDSCVYTPASLTQNYVVAVPGSWRILALTPSHAERVLVAGGPATDTNRPVTGSFSVLPGERVILEAYMVCTGQATPTVTVPGTGTGVPGSDVCANDGVMYTAG
ncbi:MAG: hypothetical protein QOK43_312 [Acidimicrobiaceae bacterium]|nr:hypothetical protein [Acidimicrobiaceae bacterium]